MKYRNNYELDVAAHLAIARKSPICYEICTETSQIFDNVKEMHWFFKAVKDKLMEKT